MHDAKAIVWISTMYAILLEKVLRDPEFNISDIAQIHKALLQTTSLTAVPILTVAFKDTVTRLKIMLEETDGKN